MRGFEAQEFELFYQLQFAAVSRQVSGAEALLRWNHPERGLLTPLDFMAAAEEIGVIEKLDAFSVQSALEARHSWAQLGFDVPKISVNVSARRLKEMNVSQLVAQYPDMAGRIAFELLETIDLNTVDSVSKWNIQALQDAGIDLEIDDFGTGHTSILSLVQLKPNRIKIDKDLVLPAPESLTARDVVRSIVSIARTLNIGVTAEGVETEAHADLMRDLGCDTLQGYALARPLRSTDIHAGFIATKPPKAGLLRVTKRGTRRA
jgi:EAL domain-containing protein (putative c-di-GMP-specific phosphodiesterase class I)